MISKANWTDFSSIDGGNALATMNRVLPPWVSLLLVIVIGWQLAKIIWLLVPGTSAGDAVPVASDHVPPRSSQQVAAPMYKLSPRTTCSEKPTSDAEPPHLCLSSTTT